MENIKPLDAEGLAILWTQILLQFVKKEEGKGLSTNDLTNELLQKIQSAGTSNFDGYYNSLIGQPQINGITLTGNKTLEDLGVTQAITDAIGNVTQISFEVIPSFADLPIIGEVGTFYLTPNNGSGNNNYDEWIWNEKNSMYELIGSIQSDIDLSNYYTKTEVDNLINGIQSSQSDCAPVGTIISYMGINAPTGYLKCDGTIYNISQYPELANHFKSNFGKTNYFGGNGSSTFAVPDLRGEFLRGTGTASRNTGSGENVGVHQDGTEHLASFYWSSDDRSHVVLGNRVNLNNCNEKYLVNSDKKINENNASSADIPAPIVITGSTNQTCYFTSRPTNTSVLYCIKYKKVVDIV